MQKLLARPCSELKILLSCKEAQLSEVRTVKLELGAAAKAGSQLHPLSVLEYAAF